MEVPMECRQVQNRLSAFQDGELKPQEKEKIGKHLQNCLACCERYEELEKVWQDLGNLKEISPQPGFYGQLANKIKEINEPRLLARFRWLFEFFSPSWATSALLVGGLLMGTFLGNVLFRNELLPFQQNRTYSQAAADVFSLRAFDPAPPGTLGERYLRMASYGEGGHR
jgi:anti-sigma factor RsiW